MAHQPDQSGHHQKRSEDAQNVSGAAALFGATRFNFY
jgi:hypothetical protein